MGRVKCTWWLPSLAVLESTVVGTGWANSCPGCMDGLRECYSHLVEDSFLVGKAAWALSTCLTTESAACSLMSGRGQGYD